MTKEEDEARISAALRDLWERNLPMLQQRLDVLDHAALVAASGVLPEAAQREALSIAHKLSGSLGMFGYQRGTEIAREIEQILKAPTPASLAQLTALTKDLRQSLTDRAIPDSGDRS